jgi:hypothetical protein
MAGRQRAGGAVFQREEGEACVLADLEDLHDVGMLQTGDRLRLDAEAFQLGSAGVAARQDHLQGDDAIELEMPSLVNNAHAAAAQFGEHFVARHRSALSYHGAGR